MSLEFVYLSASVALGIGDELLFFLLRFFYHGVCHFLSGEQSGAHSVLGGAVLLDLVDEHLHLGLERGVFFEKSGIVLGQLVEKFVDHGHVIAAHDGFLKYVGGNFLRCKHRSLLRSEIQAVIFKLVDEVALYIDVIGRDNIGAVGDLLYFALAGVRDAGKKIYQPARDVLIG
ncbi:hypothetical protein SDC9_198332 [bioreactor metagenome]|uniref:Uncharacterized protein n=1 Tax=bioreactor metagenome TaxID=1076179 RepID=A0A645IHW3_9ZZZZ